MLPGLGLLVGLAFLLVMAAIAVVTGLKPVTLGAEPSGLARTEIPPVYLRLYQELGERYGPGSVDASLASAGSRPSMASPPHRACGRG